MSNKALKDFLSALKNNKIIQEQIGEINNLTGKIKTKDIARIANENGYELTSEEVITVVELLDQQNDDQNEIIADEILDVAAGGLAPNELARGDGLLACC